MTKKNDAAGLCKMAFGRGRASYWLVAAATAAVFLWQGTSIWAEIVIEFLRYAKGEKVVESFGGYVTGFPILTGWAYHYLHIEKIMNWYTFSTLVSGAFTLLCAIAMLQVLRRKKVSGLNIFLIFLVLCAMLAHPSVSSLINITHLGYIPVVLWIALCAFEGTIIDTAKDIPIMALIPLVLSVISKPSFFSLTFLLIIVFTKMYKRPVVSLLLLVASGATIAQLMSFGEVGGLSIGGIAGILKFAIAFVMTIGGGLLFPVTYFIVGMPPYPVKCAAGVLGVLYVGGLLLRLWKKRRCYDVWIGTAALFAITAACVMPYITMNWTIPLKDMLNNCLLSCFWKHKLQYQLTSSVVLVPIFLFIVDEWLVRESISVAVRRGTAVVLVVALTNGLLSGLYSGHWQTVNKLEGEGISYLNNDCFMFPPMPDWDYDGSEYAIGGWFLGNRYSEFVNKPETVGGEFRNINTSELPVVEGDRAKIYLMLSDPTVGAKNPTKWIDWILHPDGAKTYSVGEQSVVFTEATDWAIRYAMVNYSPELLQFLAARDYTIVSSEQSDAEPISAAHLNYVVVW